MNTLALHSVVAEGLDPAAAQRRFGSTEPVPIVAEVGEIPPSGRFKVRINEQLQPPQFYLFEVANINAEILIDSGTLFEVKTNPNLSAGSQILRISSRKLGALRLIASNLRS